jgi:hypothetical protein
LGGGIGGGIGGYGFLEGGKKGGGVGLFLLKGWGVLIFQPGKKNTLRIRAIFGTVGFRRLINRSKELFGSVLSCSKPFLPTLGDFFCNFRDFFRFWLIFFTVLEIFSKG